MLQSIVRRGISFLILFASLFLGTHASASLPRHLPGYTYAFVAASPETLLYDPDGNLTNDGRFTYTWDSENHLTKVESLTNAPTGSRRRATFEYDFMGRRIRMGLSVSNTTWTVTVSNKFLYDGWNLVAELNATNNAVIRSYAWAGNVGGLLWVNDASALGSNSTHFVTFDGNGNVSTLVNAGDSSLSAKYEYGPFGDLIQASGPMGRANPIRFSTKYQDDVTGSLYFGHRYYSPETRRWLSRDPIQEAGGLNLYAAFLNDPINVVDENGLDNMVPSGCFQVQQNFVYAATQGDPTYSGFSVTLPSWNGQTGAQRLQQTSASFGDNALNLLLSVGKATMTLQASDPAMHSPQEKEIVLKMAENTPYSILAQEGHYLQGSAEDWWGTGLFLVATWEVGGPVGTEGKILLRTERECLPSVVATGSGVRVVNVGGALDGVVSLRSLASDFLNVDLKSPPVGVPYPTTIVGDFNTMNLPAVAGNDVQTIRASKVSFFPVKGGYVFPEALANQATSVGATRIVIQTGSQSVAPLVEGLTSSGWVPRVRTIGGRIIVTATPK